jgi:hypothetical protein
MSLFVTAEKKRRTISNHSTAKSTRNMKLYSVSGGLTTMQGRYKGGSGKESPVSVPKVGAKREGKVTAEERKELLSRNAVDVHNSSVDKSGGSGIIKQEEEQRKRAAEIRRIREEVIPLMPTDKLVPRQDIHRAGTKMYEERKASLKAIKQHGSPYLTIPDDEVLELVNHYKGTGEIKLSKRMVFI